jgi:hypothetical protein
LSTEYTSAQPIAMWWERPITILAEVNIPISLYQDAHAWLAYSLRVLLIWSIAIIATTDLWKRRRVRSPLELAAFASAFAIACCWLADELVTRPALDRVEHVLVLSAWLVVLGLLAAGSVATWAKLRPRLRSIFPRSIAHSGFETGA